MVNQSNHFLGRILFYILVIAASASLYSAAIDPDLDQIESSLTVESGRISCPYIERHDEPEFPGIARQTDASARFYSPPQLDSFIETYIVENQIPGLSACAIQDDSIIWKGAYGRANIEENIPVQDSTIFLLASISKTVVAVALLQLYEDGIIDLDEDINNYLPQAITNPYYPDSIITFRMLMTHTSSLLDDWVVLTDLVVWSGDSPISLETFIEDYFLPGGAYYDISHFANEPPGTYSEYSNVGATLLGYLVELISGLPFDQYCREFIFLPLNMMNTAWFLRDLDTFQVAMPYIPEATGYSPCGHYGFPDYPDGQLRTTSMDLARFLGAVIGFGQHQGARILDSTTVVEMLTPQIPAINPGIGLIWAKGVLYGRELWGHSGGWYGVLTYMYFSPAEKTGAIILTNGMSSLVPVLHELFEFAADYDDDEIPNGLDNCPYDYNPDQADINSDGIGDACCCTGQRGDVNCAGGDEPDISDVVRLIDYLYLSKEPLCCPAEADATGNGGEPDISDIVRIIDYLYLETHTPPAPCP